MEQSKRSADATEEGSSDGNTPPPTPGGLQSTTPRPLDSPPHKRLKQAQAMTPRPGILEPETPAILAETPGRQPLQYRRSDNWSDQGLPETPAPPIERRQSSAGTSSPSDISSSSVRGRDGSTSPITPFVPEVPPAPPSTPASDLQSRMTPRSRLEGFSTPLPYAAVLNAAKLEQQQNLADGAVTPAPTKPAPKSGSSQESTRQPKQGLSDDFEDWAVGKRYKLLRMLGRGSYGEVAQALDLHQDRPDAYVAIKRIQSPFDQEVDAVRLFREIHILRRLRGHECIVDLLDVVQPPSDDLADFNDLYLVFEYVDTDLYKLVMSPQFLTTEHIQTFLYQMLTGLRFLHSASVIHRDLKPANILLNEDCSLKICDFGLARIVDADRMMTSSDDAHVFSKGGREMRTPNFSKLKRAPLTRQLTKHVVTRWYRAPELILIQPYTSAVDIWSLGCILAELLSMQEGSVPGYQDRTPLFPGGTCYPLSGETGVADERLDQLSVIFGVIGTPSVEDIASIGKAHDYIKTLGKVTPKKLQDLFPAADPSALDLLRRMLMFNPKRRCTAEEALEHEFMKGVRRKEMERKADEQLIGPEFLNELEIDLQTVKQKTYEEVLWYRNQDPRREQAGS